MMFIVRDLALKLGLGCIERVARVRRNVPLGRQKFIIVIEDDIRLAARMVGSRGKGEPA